MIAMPPFVYATPVRFADVDHAGIVYYPRFFHFFHLAFEELWRARLGARAYVRLLDEDKIGFPAVRANLSMNVRNRYPGKGRNAEVDVELRRIESIWADAKKPFLFGPFCAADAMFAPVVLRFRTYEPPLSAASKAYMDAMLALPAMKEWIAAAEREGEAIPKYDSLYG